MPLDFTCPHCDRSTVVADEFAGQTGPCRACGRTVRIPPSGLMTSPLLPSTDSVGLADSVAAGGLVLVAGALLVLAFLAPVIQADREAARRRSCNNSLKQISVGVSYYHRPLTSTPPAEEPNVSVVDEEAEESACEED